MSAESLREALAETEGGIRWGTSYPGATADEVLYIIQSGDLPPDLREAIADYLRREGPCTCIDAYKRMRKPDPRCAYHEYVFTDPDGVDRV